MAAAVLVMLAGLGRGSLRMYDEGLTAERARQMLVTGDFVTPRLAGEPDFNKPPLVYWLTAASIHLQGPTVLAARLPSALLGVLCVGLVVWWGECIRPGAGLAAGFLLLTNTHFLLYARQALLETAFSASLLVPFVVARERGRGLGGQAASGLAAGLGGLSKNPFSIAGHLFAMAPWPSIRVGVAGLGVFALVGLGWYGLQWLLHGEEFVRYFWEYNTVERFTRGIEGHATNLDYYLKMQFNRAPLSFVLCWVPLAVATACRPSRIVEVGRPLALVLCWLAVIHVFAGYRENYLIPIYPFLALLGGWGLLECARLISSRRLAAVLLAAVAATCLGYFVDRYVYSYDESPNLYALCTLIVHNAAKAPAVYTVHNTAPLASYYLDRTIRRVDPRELSGLSAGTIVIGGADRPEGARLLARNGDVAAWVVED
jgi:4-amino-4-deoxy-L-arabinose transferase-like glycosyltransferase